MFFSSEILAVTHCKFVQCACKILMNVRWPSIAALNCISVSIPMAHTVASVDLDTLEIPPHAKVSTHYTKANSV